MRDEIQDPRVRPGIDRVVFVARAAVGLAAACEGSGDVGLGFGGDHEARAKWAIDGAEVLWAELCERFPDDADETED